MIWAKLWFHDAKPMQTFTTDIQQKRRLISRIVSFQRFIQLIQRNASLSLRSFISFLFLEVTLNSIAYSQT